MTAATSIASLLAPAASTAGRSLAPSAETPADGSFEALLQQAQAVQPDNTKASPSDGKATDATVPQTLPSISQETLGITPSAVPATEPSLQALASQPALEAVAPWDEAITDLTTGVSSDGATLAMLAGFQQTQPVAMPLVDAAPDVGFSQMPATTTAAVQAQALGANPAQAGAASPTDTASTGTTPAEAALPAATDNATVDAAQLAELAAMAKLAPRKTATDSDKPVTQQTATDPQAPSAATGTTQPARGESLTQAAVQGHPHNPTKDPLQAITATTGDATQANDTPATPSATPAPSAATSFAVELRQVATPSQAPVPTMPVPVDALAVNIARKFEQGLNQFEISLTPGDLGKLDISLKIGDDGRVQAVLRAERQDTLDLLRQDARTLENQLRQAGLDVGSNALSFQLSQGNAHRYKSALSGPAFGATPDSNDQPAQLVGSRFIASRRPDGVDIHV